MRRPDTKPFDRIFFLLFLPLMLLFPVIAGLDAARFHWSEPPEWLIYPGAVIFVLATALVTWTLAVNRHAESTVRIQVDRGHTVVSTGPYRYVRHPMYVGIIVSYSAAPMILGSVWAFAVWAAMTVLFIWRTAKEDATLQRELAGYKEFAERTRYRLLPGVW